MAPESTSIKHFQRQIDLDDTDVYSRDWQEHLLHLALVFEHLAIYRFTIVQTGHIEAIRNASPPRTRKQMRSSLGVYNWEKEYIPNFSIIIAPLSAMLSTKRTYIMTPKNVKYFDTAKAAFQQPILDYDHAHVHAHDRKHWLKKTRFIQFVRTDKITVSNKINI